MLSPDMLVLGPDRRRRLKRAFTTRYVPESEPAGLVTSGTPRPGDLVVARVAEIRQHEKLELTTGRRARIHPGDEVLVAYGNRYAPAQYEAYVPAGLGPCDLVAAGGIAAETATRHSSKKPPTALEPIGLAVDRNGRVLNLDGFALPYPAGYRTRVERPATIVVAGTAMDSGKTTTAAALIRGLCRLGLKVGAAKLTGTGSGGDIWAMVDSGADPVIDFTSAGMASTYMADEDELIEAADLLLGNLADAGVDVAVVEIADGVYQRESAALLASSELAEMTDRVVFAAGDAAGAAAGVERLESLDLPVDAVSGKLTASPLAILEAEQITGRPVLSVDDLAGPTPAAMDALVTTRRSPDLVLVR